MSDDKKELPGNLNFPVATASAGYGPKFAPPTMFYVWVFFAQADDYVPLGAFNTREEADQYKASVEAWCSADGRQVTFAGAVIEMPWNEFCEMAVGTRLKDLAQPLKLLAGTMPKEIEELVSSLRPGTRIVYDQGTPEEKEVILGSAFDWRALAMLRKKSGY